MLVAFIFWVKQIEALRHFETSASVFYSTTRSIVYDLNLQPAVSIPSIEYTKSVCFRHV